MMRRMADDAMARVAYVEGRERALLERSDGRMTFTLAGLRFQALGSRLWLAYMTLWVAIFDMRRR
jgi:hypothetical protein